MRACKPVALTVKQLNKVDFIIHLHPCISGWTASQRKNITKEGNYKSKEIIDKDNI